MPKLCAYCIQMTARKKKLLRALIWLGGLSPLIGIFALVFLARLGDLPNTETLANPRTVRDGSSFLEPT